MNDQMTLLAALQRDISDRLRPLCGDLSDESFERLVRDIAAVKIKYSVEYELSASLRLQPDFASLDSGASENSSVA